MGANYSHTTRSDGTTLTASIYNSDHQNHIDNMIPNKIDDQSSNDAAMQATIDPYPAASISKPTNLQGELERLRYVIKQITGEAQWYIDPDNDIASMESDINTAQTDITALQATDVVTTRGDIIRGDASGDPERLAVGTSGQVITTDGTDVSWGTVKQWSLAGEITGGTSGQKLGELTSNIAGATMIRCVFDAVTIDTTSKLIYIGLGSSSFPATGHYGHVQTLRGGAPDQNGAGVSNGAGVPITGDYLTTGGDQINGIVEFAKHDDNIWGHSGNVARTGSAAVEVEVSAGQSNPGGAIDRIQVTCESAAEFNGGSVHVWVYS